MDTLKHLIDEKTKRLETLKDPGFAPLLKGWSSFWLILSSFLLVCGIGGCVSDGGPDGWDGWTLIFWVGVMMMAFTVATATQVKSTSEKDTPDQQVHRSFQLTDEIVGRAELPEVRQLEQEIAALRKNLRKSEELTKIESELATLNPDRFGCQTTEELGRLRDSRRAMMQRIMGNENGQSESAARLQPLPANVTDKVIGYVPDVTPPEGITVEDDEELMRAWCIEVAKKFNKASVTSLAARDHRDVVDVVVRGNGGVIVKLVSGQVTVICHQLRPKVPEQFLKMLMAEGVIGTTAVAWQKKAYDEGLQSGLCANDVLEIDTVEPERPGAKK